MDGVAIGEGAMIALCLGSNAFFSATETALTAVAKLDSSKPEATQNSSLWLERPTELLATILVGRNVSKIVASVLAADLSMRYLGSFALATAIAGMSVLVLGLGETLPKSLALAHAPSLAPRLSAWLGLPHALLRASGILWLLRGLSLAHRPLLSELDLEFLISLGAKEGVLTKDKEEMLQSVLEFSDTRVKQIMVPRTAIKAIELQTDFQTLRDILREELHSRLPVYDETMDRIVGIFHVKDILRVDEASFRLEKVMHPPHFVPMHMMIGDLLKDLKRRRIHMAMVVDEFGGTAGMVTLEDILEEIVGDISDEYDGEEPSLILEQADGSWLVDGRAEVWNLAERLHLDFPEDGEYNSLAGFLTAQTGRILPPRSLFEYGGFKFEVLEGDERRISKVKIWPAPTAEQPPGHPSAEAEIQPQL